MGLNSSNFMQTSFGHGGTGFNFANAASENTGGALKLTAGVSRPATVISATASSVAMTADGAGSELNADNLTLVSKSDAANPLRTFKMDMNADNMMGLGMEQSDVMGANATHEGTRMSDNEAFMAYMSKADAGDDDED